MNVILYKQIIQQFYTEKLSEEVIICLIRAGMVLTITEIWKVFVEKRDASGNIANSMEEATRNKIAKTKVYNSKKAVTKMKKTYAKKSSKAMFKNASKETKKSMILEKSETKHKFPMDDYQSKKGVSTLVDMPQENIETSADAIQESEETVDSQETISDYELYSNRIPEINAVEKRKDLSASFRGK